MTIQLSTFQLAFRVGRHFVGLKQGSATAANINAGYRHEPDGIVQHLRRLERRCAILPGSTPSPGNLNEIRDRFDHFILQACFELGAAIERCQQLAPRVHDWPDDDALNRLGSELTGILDLRIVFSPRLRLAVNCFREGLQLRQSRNWPTRDVAAPKCVEYTGNIINDINWLCRIVEEDLIAFEREVNARDALFQLKLIEEPKAFRLWGTWFAAKGSDWAEQFDFTLGMPEYQLLRHLASRPGERRTRDAVAKEIPRSQRGRDRTRNGTKWIGEIHSRLRRFLIGAFSGSPKTRSRDRIDQLLPRDPHAVCLNLPDHEVEVSNRHICFWQYLLSPEVVANPS